ncbi:HTH-type transcriptional regulator YodB [bacterium BMS3Abin02]|nr:HTH-type transcriptional regulator YodB [bacterium BMS3Abin02]GBE23314.1 HTH-type transcriptional regulator YodB [bacterium BMS3Bbin01]HDH24649.1 transcriptional regulator [Actinomycetota bacterium]
MMDKQLTDDGVSKAVFGYCPRFHAAVELIGSRWTGAILLVMLGGASRFSTIHDAIPGLSDRLLSERLRELEAAGVVRRDVSDTKPVTITYTLTDKGQALAPVVQEILNWSQIWQEI